MIPRKQTRQTTRNIERAFALARQVARSPQKFPEEFIAIPLEWDQVSSLFTKKRIRLLRVLRDQGPFDSVRALAQALRRDETRVGRDLETLVAMGLACLERDGKRKRVSAPRKPIILA